MGVHSELLLLLGVCFPLLALLSLGGGRGLGCELLDPGDKGGWGPRLLGLGEEGEEPRPWTSGRRGLEVCTPRARGRRGLRAGH